MGKPRYTLRLTAEEIKTIKKRAIDADTLGVSEYLVKSSDFYEKYKKQLNK